MRPRRKLNDVRHGFRGRSKPAKERGREMFVLPKEAEGHEETGAGNNCETNISTPGANGPEETITAEGRETILTSRPTSQNGVFTPWRPVSSLRRADKSHCMEILDRPLMTDTRISRTASRLSIHHHIQRPLKKKQKKNQRGTGGIPKGDKPVSHHNRGRAQLRIQRTGPNGQVSERMKEQRFHPAQKSAPSADIISWPRPPGTVPLSY
ncbi:unnamed protein product [Cuscuta europaea]|uniref:Uncharacterized protein n=1 Tax=Cuscuta europaea TaxID=41803 RepID=A0A9P0YU52_CUSEU|nr:unnamed protein product [Cuscuta europaea]